MRKCTFGIALLFMGLLLTGSTWAQDADALYGKNIQVDGANDFDYPQTEDVDEYLIAIDDGHDPAIEELAPIWSQWSNGIGDAPIEDNWNHWIGPEDDYSANPMEMSKLYATNDQLYLYIGLVHTDTDGLPQPGGFGYWNTQIGVVIDVNRTPTGGNQSEASPSGFMDPWGNNEEFFHEHRPDFIAWFDHHSNDFKLYRWDVEDEKWNEILQDLVDDYYPELEPGFYKILGDDGIPNRDDGPYSGPNKFVEFQIPLRVLGIDYNAVYGVDEGVLEPPVISLQAWCTQPGRGAYDSVPTDSQIGHYPSMGDWAAGGDKTDLSQYADYILLESPDQVPPTILFESLPYSVILESSTKGLDRITVLADVSDQTADRNQQSSIATLDSEWVFYVESAEERDSVFVISPQEAELATKVKMVNISGTQLWLADIPDSVYFFIQAEDGTYTTRAPKTPAGIDTLVYVFPPPMDEEVTWAKLVDELDMVTVFAPDGTILEIPPGAVTAVGDSPQVSIAIPDPTTFTAPPPSTAAPPHATNGFLTLTGLYREISTPDKGPKPFGQPARLTFHYVDELIAGNESQLRLYHWNETTERWVRAGGRVYPVANIVQAEITQAGIYGLFVDRNVSGAMASVIDDLHLDPNPFSPNGDGHYDDLSIQFTLNTDALLRIEIYDVIGDLVKTLFDAERLARGGHNLMWDGRDLEGEVVPFGFYFVFIFAKSAYEELPIAKMARGVGVIR